MARRRGRRATELKLAGYGGQRPEDRSSRSRTRGSPWRRRSTTIAATTCPHHVKAKGRDLDHKRDVDKERASAREVSTISIPANELAFSHDSQ